MSKQRTKSKKAAAEKSPQLSRRKLLILPVAAVLIGTAAAGISSMEASNRELHDLSVIGQGVPVIVQIHDTTCPTCRRLKNVVSNSLEKTDSIHYRLADIKTSEGKALQNKYNVPNVTLLYFDARGRHVNTTTGMQTSDDIRAAINALTS